MEINSSVIMAAAILHAVYNLTNHKRHIKKLAFTIEIPFYFLVYAVFNIPFSQSENSSIPSIFNSFNLQFLQSLIPSIFNDFNIPFHSNFNFFNSMNLQFLQSSMSSTFHSFKLQFRQYSIPSVFNSFNRQLHYLQFLQYTY